METRTLTDNITMPLLGFGTYLISDEDAPAAVGEAIRAGYRHIDTAEGYRNEAGVGTAIRAALERGDLTREDLFVTTKLWPGNPAWGHPIRDAAAIYASLDASLERLGLDHVDLYLIHAPFAGAQRVAQWRALVELRERGKARAIGVSNFGIAHLEEIAAAGLPMPHADQLELHPWSQKPELVRYLDERGIVPIAYSSLIPLSSWRAAPGQHSAKTGEMREEADREDAPLKVMADKYGVSEARLLLRWGVQKGYPVLPKSMRPERIRDNADIFGFVIAADDMAAIEKMDRGPGIAWQGGDPLEAP